MSVHRAAPAEQAPTARARARLRRALLGLGLAALAGSLPAREARAGDCHPASGLSTCVDADNLWVRPGAGPFFAVGPTLTAPASRASFGLALSYLSRPIGLTVASADKAGTTIHPLDNMVDATLLFSLGITDRLELSAAAPMTLYQGGAGIAAVTGGDAELLRSAVRDVRFGAAFAILPRPRVGVPGGLALTARLDFAAPTGSSGVFAREATMAAVPSLVLDERLGRLTLAAEAGARLRGETRLANAVVGSQLYYALGASYDAIPGGMLTVAAEAFALQTLAAQGARKLGDSPGSTPPLVPAEWIASVTSASLLAGDLSVTVGGGGPIPLSPEALTTPRFRFDLALRYAPTGHDRDGDGILDRDDTCPDVAEDRDGFQDQDGCPDPDNDHDGIPDVKDRCRDAAEDFDGFQDADGCPDEDDDHDGIPDAQDKCRNEPEDKDGFQDADGCPDPDNDEDGIPDKTDKCPNGPEDFDGFKDQDGCPDPDNDLDGVDDKADQCPNEPEDRDGFQDQDGCPDPDNDEDGILDKADRCPNDAETIDGVQDEDGCPEKGARSLVGWAGNRVTIEVPARFPAGSAKPGAELEKQAKEVAQLLRGRAPLASVILEAYADRQGDRSAKAADLAAKRAEAIKSVLVANGVPADKIVAAAGDATLKRDAKAAAFDVTVTREPRGQKPRAAEKKKP